jgi:small ligand-binding sensory domain FIST
MRFEGPAAPFPCATGLASAPQAHADLAARAVQRALGRAGLQRAESVLLFLSSDFAHNPRPALVAAARAAQTLNVAGCTAPGLITDEDWVLDAPSAAALVCGPETNRHPLAARDQPWLTLAAPDALNQTWLHTPRLRYGGVAGDATGRGPFKVWQQGQLQLDGRCALPMPGAAPALVLSRGLQAMGEVLEVDRAEGFDLQQVNGGSAAETLRRAFRNGAGTARELPPLYSLALGREDAQQGLAACWPVVSVNPDDSVTVATHLQAGEALRWMQYSAAHALAELETGLASAQDPALGLMFSCSSRGAALHGGLDREWALVRHRFPAMPLLGFYGNGQILHDAQDNHLIHHSVVLALFPGGPRVDTPAAC